MALRTGGRGTRVVSNRIRPPTISAFNVEISKRMIHGATRSNDGNSKRHPRQETFVDNRGH